MRVKIDCDTFSFHVNEFMCFSSVINKHSAFTFLTIRLRWMFRFLFTLFLATIALSSEKKVNSVRTSMHSSFLCKGQMFLILFSVDTCLHVVDDLMGLVKDILNP